MTQGTLGVFIPSSLGLLGGAGRGVSTLRKIGPLAAMVTVSEKHEDELQITDHPVELGVTVSDHAFRRPSMVTIRCSWSNSPNRSSGTNPSAAGALNTLLPLNAVQSAVPRLPGSGATPVAAGVLVNRALSQSVSSYMQATSPGAGGSPVRDVYQQLLDLQLSLQLLDVYTGKRTYKNMLIQSIIVDTDRTSENSLEVLLRCREVIVARTATVTVQQAPASSQADPAATAAPVEQGLVSTVPAPATGNSQLVAAIGGINSVSPAP